MQQKTKEVNKRFNNIGIRHLDWMALIWDADLPSNGKFIAAYLNGFMNSQRDIAWPSLKRIETETGLSHATVLKYLDILEESGWIKRERGNSSRNTQYVVCYPIEIQELIEGRSAGDLRRSTDDLQVGQQATPNKQINKQVNKHKGFELPSWVNKEAWGDFENHRNAIKKPLTDQARKLNLTKLEGLTKETQAIVVNRTIENRWTGLFPPKPDDISHAPNMLPSGEVVIM